MPRLRGPSENTDDSDSDLNEDYHLWRPRRDATCYTRITASTGHHNRRRTPAKSLLGNRDGVVCVRWEQVTIGAVRRVLGEHSWLHLACHGSQDLVDALYDGALSLNVLMSTTSDNAELAFLSACPMAVGDEKIPEESMHLAAGMLAVGYKGVIATMWSIRDDAPLIVEAYSTGSCSGFARGGHWERAKLVRRIRCMRRRSG